MTDKPAEAEDIWALIKRLAEFAERNQGNPIIWPTLDILERTKDLKEFIDARPGIAQYELWEWLQADAMISAYDYIRDSYNSIHFGPPLDPRNVVRVDEIRANLEAYETSSPDDDLD